MKILALSPHTDDVELGCGASLARWIDEGHEVIVCAFSRGSDETGATMGEFVRATEKLGCVKRGLHPFAARTFPQQRQEILQLLIDGYANWPSLVIGPPSCSIHQDHQVIAAEMARAFPHCSILAYEELKQNAGQRLGYYVSVSRACLNRKIAAIACYESQAGRAYTAPAYIEALARVRGMQCGAGFAEAFEVVRWVE